MKIENTKPCCQNYKYKKFCADCGDPITVAKDQCRKCGGEGEYEEGQGYAKGFVTCEDCHGVGKIVNCNKCGGKTTLLKKGVLVCQDCVSTQRLPLI